MTSLSSHHALLQDYQPRPPPITIPLFSNVLGTPLVHKDANFQLVNLATKSVRDRRRKQTTRNLHPALHLPTSSPLGKYLFFDSKKISEVYSEVMMDKAGASKTAAASSSPTTASTPLLGVTQAQQSQKGVYRRQNPANPALNGNIRGEDRLHQSKRLTQALFTSQKMRGLDISIDLQSARPSSIAVSTRMARRDDLEDDDWADFISSGYGEFPLPPKLAESPTTASTATASTGRSDGSFRSASTSATSLASSSPSKLGDDWMNEDFAWASSDEEKTSQDSTPSPLIRLALNEEDQSEEEEEEEVVESPTDASSLSNRGSQNSEVFGETRFSCQSIGRLNRYSRSSGLQNPTLSRFSLDTDDEPSRESLYGRGSGHTSRSSMSSRTSLRAFSTISRDSSCATSPSARPYSISTRYDVGAEKLLRCSPDTGALPTLLAALCDGSTAPRISSPASLGSKQDRRRYEGKLLHSPSLSPVARCPASSYVKRNNADPSEGRDTLVETKGNQLQPGGMLGSLQSDGQYNVAHRYRSGLSPGKMPEKAQRRAEKLRTRLSARLSTVTGFRRSSNPDAPVTPNSADGDHVKLETPSPNTSNFGRAAINVRASEYVSAAAASTSMSRQESQGHLDTAYENPLFAPISKSGFCFDYDPASPMYLSFDSQVPSPTSRSPLAASSASISRRKKSAAKDAVVSETGEGYLALPHARNAPSFRHWR